MNNHLQSLNNSYVFTYILQYTPTEESQDKGILNILDNTSGGVSQLSSYYGLYIDHLFIAGGYGFKTFQDFQIAKNAIDNFENFKNDISQTLNDVSNQQTIFEFKGTENAEIGSQEVNLNILSPEYNSYNYITSYQYFKVTKDNLSDSSNNKYILSLNTQSNLRYIDSINIEQNNANNNDIVEIEDLSSINIQKYKIKLSIHQKTSSNIIKYNDDLKLYVYSKLNEEYKNTEINLNNVENTTINKEFNKPLSDFKDDLVVEIRKPSSVIGQEIVVYSYMIPNFLKWQDKFVIYPTPGTSVDTRYNIYNFRDTNTNIDDPDCYRIYQNLVTNTFISSNYINVNNNNEIELNFSSNEPMYDYIIFRNNYNIEFYFNGLQSHNWECKNTIIGSNRYYIWQSPQKYFGNHFWKIKINM